MMNMRAIIQLCESHERRGFHVTDREIAEKIMQTGFLGGWGDVGFGVYFWNNVHSAYDYADEGGWDNGLTDPVIIEVHDPALEAVTDIDPSWDASKYQAMLWVPLDEDNEGQHWKPQQMRLVG